MVECLFHYKIHNFAFFLTRTVFSLCFFCNCKINLFFNRINSPSNCHTEWLCVLPFHVAQPSFWLKQYFIARGCCFWKYLFLFFRPITNYMHILQNWKESTLHLSLVPIYESLIWNIKQSHVMKELIWHQVQPLDPTLTTGLSLELPLGWELFGCLVMSPHSITDTLRVGLMCDFAGTVSPLF